MNRRGFFGVLAAIGAVLGIGVPRLAAASRSSIGNPTAQFEILYRDNIGDRYLIYRGRACRVKPEDAERFISETFQVQKGYTRVFHSIEAAIFRNEIAFEIIDKRLE